MCESTALRFSPASAVHRLANAARFLENSQRCAARRCLKVQIADAMPFEWRCQSIPSLTPIDDDVPPKSKQQYETFPYPLWNALNKEASSTGRITTASQGRGHLRGAKAKICCGMRHGTGSGVFSPVPDATNRRRSFPNEPCTRRPENTECGALSISFYTATFCSSAR